MNIEKTLKILGLGMLATVIVGCVNEPKSQESGIPKDIQEVLIPEIGETNKAYLGERMMFSGVGWYVDCLIPNFNFTDTRNIMYEARIIAGEEMCAKGADAKVFYPEYINWTPKFKYPIKLKELDNGLVNFSFATTGVGLNIVDVEKDKFDIIQKFTAKANSFQQTLEYTGRDGEILTFVYSEFKDDLARDAFTREFRVDLSKGNQLNYKGAIVEIIDANNSEITYKVIKSFVMR